MFPRSLCGWAACVACLFTPAPGTCGGTGRPAGTAFLRSLPIREPPFGQRRQDTFPWDGVRIQRWRRDQPGVDWLVAWIDLRTPGLGYRVTDVQYRTGPAGLPFQSTVARTTVDFLRRHSDPPRVDLAVNTVAFWPCPAANGTPVFLSEPAWQGDDNGRDPEPGSLMLGLLPGRALIGPPEEVRAARPLHAFGSFRDAGGIPGGIAVRDGQALTFAVTDVHARTMAGVSEDGRILILLVADGYNPGVSDGFELGEAAQVLWSAGAYQGIFLDGGGSSALVGRGDDGGPAVFNRPAGLLNRPGTLRYIAVNLGFTGLRRSAEPLPALEDWRAPAYVVAWCETVTWVRVYPLRAALAGTALGVLLLASGLAWWQRRKGAAATGEPVPGGDVAGPPVGGSMHRIGSPGGPAKTLE